VFQLAKRVNLGEGRGLGIVVRRREENGLEVFLKISEK